MPVYKATVTLMVLGKAKSAKQFVADLKQLSLEELAYEASEGSLVAGDHSVEAHLVKGPEIAAELHAINCTGDFFDIL